MSRLYLFVLLFGLAGCPIAAETEALADAEGDPALPTGADVPLCQQDADCELVGSSCCDCPSFALHVSEGYGEACSGVVCDAEPTCSAVEAVCNAGFCEARCSAIPCDTACESGFAIDEFGCAICQCQNAAPETTECTQDTDCVRVQADCCGCEQGGQDTAVPADLADEFVRELNCPTRPACPDVNVCSDDYVARCIGNTCVLADATDGPPEPPSGLIFCGTPESPSCPQNFQCILNDPEANDIRPKSVGVCRSL